MEASQLLLEYLKEQYTQARQHETRQTAAITFLTTAAAAILGIGLKDGFFDRDHWWLGLVVALMGLANWGIIAAHQLGNRFHTKLAGKVRCNLEGLCEWVGVRTATELRIEALNEMGLRGPDISIGGIVYQRLRWIPLIMIVLGVGFAGAALRWGGHAIPQDVNVIHGPAAINHQP